MENKRNLDNDAYDELLKSFYAKSENENLKIKDEVKNRGEVYFSSNTPRKTQSKSVLS